MNYGLVYIFCGEKLYFFKIIKVEKVVMAQTDQGLSHPGWSVGQI
jgi:hypothetical protein